jgi:chromosome segregation ATPase
MPSLSAKSRRAVIGAQIGRLAGCDASLSHIAADVTGMRHELTRLRAEAVQLAQLLAEKDTALSRLEREHADASHEAQAASASLRKSEARLVVSREQVATLVREQGLLLSRLGETERGLARAEDTSSGLHDAIGERERTIEQLREWARSAEEAHSARQEAAAASLRNAEAQLDARQEELAMLQRERELLRSRIEDMNRRLEEAADTGRSLREVVAERERTIEKLREEARSADDERAAWEQRSAALARELDLSTAQHERWRAALAHSQLPQRPLDEDEPAHGVSRSESHVRLLCLPSGYRITESGEHCPHPGDVVDVDGTAFVAFSVGRSPLPLDPRWCAYLIPRSDDTAG